MAVLPPIGPPDAAPVDALRDIAEKYFDAGSYMHVNGDVRGVKLSNPAFDLKAHFLNHGIDEGRTPSIMFDIHYVHQRLARYDREDLPHTDLFRHFASLPAARKFVPNRWFSPWAFRKLYAARYPELEDLSDYGVFEVYLDRHSYAALSPCGTFSEERYRTRYQDVTVAIGRGLHRSGFMEFTAGLSGAGQRVNLPGAGGLDGGTAAEANWLMNGQAGIDPLVWWHDEVFYLSVYPDVHDLVRRAVVKSGLEHYLVAGFYENRLPSPALFRRLAVGSAIAETAGANANDNAGGDPWNFFDRLAPPDAAGHKVPLRDCCEILRFLEQAGRSGTQARITEALWPYALSPAAAGTFDATHYLAVNVDVARSVGTAPDVAEAHWRNFGLNEQRVAPGTNLFGDRTIDFTDVLSWKSGVNFFGPVNSPSGLGTAARGYAAALRAAGVPVNVYDVSWLINRALPSDLFCAAELAYSINFLCINADQVQAFALKYGTDIFNHRANVGAWVWELNAPRPEWRSVLSAFDLIVTPSRFCTESFSLFTDCPVRTVPYVVDAAAIRDATAKAGGNQWIARIEAEKSAGRKIILFIMDASSYTARKGVDIYCELARRIAQAEPGKYLFVLKSHSKDVSKPRNDPYGPAVLAVDGVFSFADLCRLKSIADLYVSPHRSEGFGLNIIESILLGVPVLCSDYAGGTDLLAGNKPPLAQVKLAEIGRDMGPYRAEAIWCEPDIAALTTGFLSYFANPPDHAHLAAMSRRLAEDLSAASIGAALRQQLAACCALGAETTAERLEAFRPLANARRDECFRLGYVSEATRRTRDAPGLDRLGEIAMLAVAPYFSVITPTYNSDPAWLHEIYDDLLHQSYPAWEWCICDDGSTRPETLAALRDLRRKDARIKLRLNARNVGIAAATNAAVATATGKYLIMIDHDDRVSPDLLASYYGNVRDLDSGVILYCDEDKIDPDGVPCESYYKPDWSPEHLLSCMYVLHCLCIRKSVFLDLGGYRSRFDGAQDHDFLLRAAGAGVPVQHLDHLLYHWRMAPASAAGNADNKVFAIEAGRQAVAAHLDRAGIAGTVTHGLIPGTYRVRPALSPGRVALNILTGCTSLPAHEDGHRFANGRDPAGTYVEQFVRSILAHPPALDFEIRVIVDRPALPLAAPLAALDPRISIISFDRAGSHFNFSEKANFALASSTADRNVLLNDDMQAIDADWLHALLEMLELPGVGVVGGRLLFADDTVQHCGIALGIYGATAHLFEGLKTDVVSYNAYNMVIRNYSAVTGAMLALRRTIFERIGGFDTEFPIDYNDVDFCLRVNEAGLRVVYTPFAQLRHFESRSAQRLAVDALDRHRFCTRWAATIARDPFYNRNLSRTGVMCELPS